MKVDEIKKIAKIISEYNFDIEWKILFSFSKEEIEKLLNAIQKENGNASVIDDAFNFLLHNGLEGNIPRLFLHEDYSNYQDVIDTFEKVSTDEQCAIVGYYINYLPVLPDNEMRILFRKQIQSVFNMEEEGVQISNYSFLLRQPTWIQLIHEGVLDEKRQEDMEQILLKVLNADENTAEILVYLLNDLPISCWQKVSSDELNLETLSIISENLDFYVDKGIVSREEGSYDRIVQLSKLCCETNSKFLELLKFRSFLGDPNKEAVLDVLLSKENEKSFDYIFDQYQVKENCLASVQSEVEKDLNEPIHLELAHVVCLLDQGYNVDQVLDGFEEEEDITVKTLVRSMNYKSVRG